MSCFTGPEIANDGIVLCLDAGNKNSYSGSGIIWNDLSGNNNSVSLVNGPTFTSLNNNSILFDGVDDYCYRSILNNTPSTAMTILAWVRPTQNGALWCQGRSGFDADTEFIFSIQNNRLAFWDYDAGPGFAGSSNTAIIFNTWYHVGFVKSALTASYFLNGVADGNLTSAKTTTYSSNDFVIGYDYRDNIQRYAGNIGTFTIYNRALSAAEIQQNFNASRSKYGI